MLSPEEQLKKLRAAYASGVFRVRFGDNEVTYKSESEMRKIIERLERVIEGKGTLKATNPLFVKGLS